MSPLAESIRILMVRRQLTGVQLARDIGLSTTSLSRILRGHAKPKQVTLTRLMKRLCASPAEEQVILRAFTGLSPSVREEPPPDSPENASAERERVERWLEARTQAITFKNAIARELDKAAISYRRDVCEGIASADFLIESGAGRVALECKANISRDFEKTLGISLLLQELMRCDEVYVVVPFVSEPVSAAMARLPVGQHVCTLGELVPKMKGGE
jgi:Helix-turn-helix.